MQLTKTGIKPCATCYKARQFAKDRLGSVMTRGTKANRMDVTTSIGTFTTETEGHTVIAAPPGYNDMMGRKVYVAGKRLIDVEKAEPVKGAGSVTRTHKYHV